MKTINEIIQENAERARINHTKRYEEDLKRGYSSYVLEKKEYFVKRLSEIVQNRIPILFAFAEITDEPLVEKIIEKYRQHKGFYFFGTVGTGKTYNLYAILRLFRASWPIDETSFWNVPCILAKFKAMYDKHDEGEEAITNYLETKGVLFLDDLGGEKQTEWSVDIIYRLLNHRLENKKPTYIASNLSLKELADKYGDRVASRIAGMCEVIKVDGEDKRLNKSLDNSTTNI